MCLIDKRNDKVSNMTDKRRFGTLGKWAMAAAVVVVLGCSSPEEKVARFNARGTELMAKGEWMKARLEFQNALQLNPNYVPALMGLVDIAERSAEWDKAYALLNKVVEVDATNLKAQLRLAKLLLAAGVLDKALAASDAASALAPEDADVLALRAALMFKLDDRKKAVELAQQALRKEPAQVDALVVLASERLAANDAAAAVKYLDQGLAANERDVALQLIKAQALEKMAQYEQAEQVFRKLIALYPDNKSFHTLLAQYYTLHGQKDKAEAEYRAVVQAFPQDLQAKLDVVRFLATARGEDASLAELNKLIAADPKNHELRFALASTLLAQGKNAQAESVFREVIQQAGTDEAGLKARNALAVELLKRGDKAGGQSLVKEVLAKDERNEQALLLKASMAMDEQRLDDAVADLRTILRDVPNSARAMALLGRAHELQGSRDLAMDYLGRSFQAGKQQSPQFGVNYAQFLLQSGKAKQAQEVLREVLGFTPNHVPALQLLAQAYLSTGDLTNAQAVADAVAKMKDQTAAASQIQGAVFAARHNFDSSIASFRKAYELSPTEVRPMMALVSTYLAAGKSKEAVSFMQGVVKASPDNLNAQLLLAQLLQQTGDTAGAQKAYEAMIAHDARFAPAYGGLAALFSSQGKWTEAEATLEKGLKAAPADFNLRLAQAGVLEALNRIDEAIAVYEELIKERPGAEVVVNNLASLLADYREDKASADRAYQLAQRLKNSNVPQFKDTLGWASYRVGKNEDAVVLLKSAADQLPDRAVVQYHYGQVQLARNNKALAKPALEKAVALSAKQPFPQAESAKKALQGL